MPLEILGSQFRASYSRFDDASRGGRLGKGATGQLKFSGSPSTRFLLGTAVNDNQQTLEIQHSAFETLVAGFGFHVAQMAKFERGERAMLGKGFPDDAGIIANAAVGIETRMVARLDGGFAHGQKIRHAVERNQGAPRAEIFGVQRESAARQFALPTPDPFEIRVEDEVGIGAAVRYRPVERWECDVIDWEDDAEAKRIDISSGVRERENRALPADFVVRRECGFHAGRKKLNTEDLEKVRRTRED